MGRKQGICVVGPDAIELKVKELLRPYRSANKAH
jgi:hypothetical protein